MGNPRLIPEDSDENASPIFVALRTQPSQFVALFNTCLTLTYPPGPRLVVGLSLPGQWLITGVDARTNAGWIYLGEQKRMSVDGKSVVCALINGSVVSRVDQEFYHWIWLMRWDWRHEEG